MPAGADLSLELTSPKPHYLLDEPLFVTATVRNVGDSDAHILRLLDLALARLTLDIAPPGERARRYRPWVTGDIGLRGLAALLLHLRPGDKYGAALDITCEGRMATTTLSRPGKYVIRATYAIPEDWPGGPVALHSNELSVVVAEPGGTDRAAYDLLQDAPQAEERGPWNAYREQASCYEALLRDFPESGYAIYARFYLAQVYEGRAHADARRSPPDAAADIRRAAGLYASVAEEAIDAPLGVYAKRLAGRCFAAVRDNAAAQALFEEAFLAPAATEADRLEVVGWLSHVQNGIFLEALRLPPRGPPSDLRLPLRAFARVLGLSVERDAAANTVTVSGPGVQCTMRPGADDMVLNGTQRTRVTISVKDGRVLVSGSVIAALMEAQGCWGRGMGKMFLPREVRARQ
jgi:hypothetical protein